MVILKKLIQLEMIIFKVIMRNILRNHILHPICTMIQSSGARGAPQFMMGSC